MASEFAAQKAEWQQALLEQRTNKDAVYSIEGDKQKASYVPIRNRSNSSSRASLKRVSSSADCRVHRVKAIASTDTIMKVPAEQSQSDAEAHDERQEVGLPVLSALPPITPTQEQLAERCLKLEQYCRDLIETNKVLDAENRLAIAQIVHLTDPNQLNHFATALKQVSSQPKTVYDA